MFGGFGCVFEDLMKDLEVFKVFIGKFFFDLNFFLVFEGIGGSLIFKELVVGVCDRW